jgi:Uma2 family endonuclease
MSTALKQMTVDEFLLWVGGKEGRWELHDGVPVLISSAPAMMSPERLAHVRTKLSAAMALQEALKRADLPCEAFTDGLAVQIDAETVFEPDASVARGPRRADDTIVVSDPVIVAEVLSPNTAGIDHGRKLSGYFSLASVQHYLILDPERRVVIHHKRGASDAIETRVLSEGAVKLNPPGFEVAVEALFPRPDQGGRAPKSELE